MRKLLFTLSIFLLVVITAQAQAPAFFNYQGTARNSVGNALVNQTIKLRLTIHDGSAIGLITYSETRTLITNAFGLFSVQVGGAGATNVIGSIAGTNWGVGTKWMQVEIDPQGGNTFKDIGTTQLTSVPYSLFATQSGDLVLPLNKSQNEDVPLFRIQNTGSNANSLSYEGLSSSTANTAAAIRGIISSTSPGGFSSGLVGQNNGTGGNGIGVIGSQAGSGWGVYGFTPGGRGVFGEGTGSGVGVFGTSSTGVAGIFTNTNVANTADALQASTNGTATSWALRATSTGLQGAGIFTLNNAGSSANALRVTTNGAGFGVNITSSNATPLALRTQGGLQFTGVGEAANRIMATVPGNGDATWVAPATVGIVTGSGTLNFVPKWTPSGTNLGNSLLFDNGANVGIGTITPASKLSVEVGNNDGISINSTGSNFANASLGFSNTTTSPAQSNAANIALKSGAGDRALQFFNSTSGLAATDRIYNFLNNSTTSVVSVLNNGNVGIGNVTPTARLEVTDGGTIPTASFTKTNAANTANTLFVSDADVTSVGAFNGGIFATKGSGGLTFLNGQTVIKGFARLAGGIGISGASGVGGISVAGTTSSGIGLVGLATDPAGYGLITIGRVQIQGQNAGLNRVLASDAVGNATWQPAAALNLVSGNGTLNFVPKWTPDGTTLGNSLIFDNGTNVGINNITPSARLDVVRTSAATAPATSIGVSSVNQTGTTATANRYSVANPAGYFVANGGAGQGIYATATAGYSSGGFSSNTAIAIQAVGTSAGIPQQRTIQSVAGNGTEFNFGIRSYLEGTAGSGYNAAINGVDNMNVANSYAGYFSGKVHIEDGTEGAGKVFTSDGSGTGSWQSQKVSIRMNGISSNITVPNATHTLITQWSSVVTEEGGANYDGTGGYTITKTGVYNIEAHLFWNTFTSAGTSSVWVWVNGVQTDFGIAAGVTTAGQFIGTVVNTSMLLNAGDVVTIRAYQTSGGNQTVTTFGGPGGNRFSISLEH